MVVPLFTQRETCPNTLNNNRVFLYKKVRHWCQGSLIALVTGIAIGYIISLNILLAENDTKAKPIGTINEPLPTMLRSNGLDANNIRDDFWCPHASCKNTGRCRTCENRYLFVIATGRSGSTTIMAMLNLLPGIRISGENNDFMYGFHKLVDDLKSMKNFEVGPNVKDGCWWHEHIEDSSFACPAQELLNTINPPPLDMQLKGQDDAFITGFKEIRWLRHEEFESDVTKFIDTYSLLFPCSRFVISIRNNVEDQAKSAFYAESDKSYSETIEYLMLLNDMHVDLYKRLGGKRAFLLDMNEWSAPGGAKQFDELAEWLGFKSCQYPTEIGNCWNYINRKEMSKTSKCMTQTEDYSLGESCRYNP